MAEAAEAISSGVNNVWILTVSFLIFFMQPGFAMLEVGQVRAKNAANVLMKNLMDWSFGVLSFFLIGNALANIVGGVTSSGGYGGGAFAYMSDPGGWIGWLFGAVFAMTAATIVSGAVAGRIKFKAFIFYSIGLTAVIYPVVLGFTWKGGLLSGGGLIGSALGVGFKDFAGAVIVHMVGGVAGLVGAGVLGARQGRFDESGNSQAIPGHNVTLAFLGTFILAFGWYGFNVGTQATVLSVGDGGALSFMGPELGRVALNTTLAMGAGAVFAILTTSITEGYPDPLFACNGLLAGLVGITGACAHVSITGGIIIGALSGIQAPLVYRWCVDTLNIDDVCGVFAVHGSAGILGTWLIPFFDTAGFSGAQLAMQTISIVIIAIWTIVATFVVFKLADAIVGLRLNPEEEQEGMDINEHGILAYPEFVSEP